MNKQFLFILSLLIFYSIGTFAQISVINQKGTRITVDSSKWVLSGTNIYNKNTGNVGLGNSSPTYKLDITGKVRITDSFVTNTARIITLTSGNANDSLLLSDATTGIVKRASVSKLINEPWNKLGSTTPATSNTDSIYITGNVSIGKSSNTAQLDVKGRINADSTVQAPNFISTVQATASGSSYTWDITKGANTAWTLSAGANTLTMSNVKAGMYGLIRVINNGTSTLTFAGAAGLHKVINGGGGVPVLTQVASAVDILTFYYDGTAYWWTIGNNYN